jgi:hypothetical protein
VTFLADVAEDTSLDLELRLCSRLGSFTPDVTLARQTIRLTAGPAQPLRLAFDTVVERPQYAFYCLLRNPAVSLYLSEQRLTGILSLSQSMNAAVAKGARQEPPEGIGIDSFEFWIPSRRPSGQNLAVEIDPPLDLFHPENVVNGVARPTLQPNAWVAAPGDARPRLTLRWPEPRTIVEVVLTFDTDFDHPMESVLMGHPEREIPFCVKHYRLLDESGALLYEASNNHQTLNRIRFERPATISALHVEVVETHGAPAALFEVRCYSERD